MFSKLKRKNKIKYTYNPISFDDTSKKLDEIIGLLQKEIIRDNLLKDRKKKLIKINENL